MILKHWIEFKYSPRGDPSANPLRYWQEEMVSTPVPDEPRDVTSRQPSSRIEKWADDVPDMKPLVHQQEIGSKQHSFESPTEG